MDPTSMDGYGYGADTLDNGFSKYTFQGQNQYSQPPQPQQSYPQQQEQFYGQQQPYQPQTTQQSFNNDPPTSQGGGAGKKFLNTFNTAFPETKKDLLFAKSFYFFFFAAFGSLFPLIGIYFKQLGMSPLQTGFLIGLRPFVELFAGPFWGDLAERWKKWKTILIASLSCWIIFTVSLAFVQPSANSCLIHNGSDIFVAKPYTISGLTFENMKPREIYKETRKKRSLLENLFGCHKVKRSKKPSPRWLCREETGSRDDGSRDDGNKHQSTIAKESSQHRSMTNCIRRKQTKELESRIEINTSSMLTSGSDKHSNVIIDNKSRMKRNAKKKTKTHTTTATAAPDEQEEEEEEEEKEEEEGDGVEEEEEVDEDKNKDGDKNKDHDEEKKEVNKDERKSTKQEKNKKSDNHMSKATDKKTDSAKDEGDDDDDDDNGDVDDDDYEYYEIDDDEPFDATKVERKHRFYQFKEFPYPAIDIPGLSPLSLNHDHVMNLEKEDVKDLVSPPLSAVVYRIQDVRNVFLILLILQILGEFLSTPSLTLADTATLGYLNDQTENYGKQRIYGSLGWAVAMFFVGIALDHSNVFSNHPCGTEHLVDRNYMTCYAVFGVFMFCALLSALKFRFKESDSPVQSVPLQQFKEKVLDKVHQKMGGGKQGQEKIENGVMDGGILLNQHEADRSNLPTNEPPQSNPITYIPRGKPGQAGTLPHWIAVLKMFAPIQFSSMLFVLWFVGFGVGLVFAFLFWHLQDLGGTPTLFGIASVINHLSELGAFLFIKKLVAKIGHLNVVYAGLMANVVRFITISYLGSPWGVLPFELLQGLTHAAVWAAGVSYMTQAIPEENKPTAQMILQSLHLAVGRGCGTVIGGIFISSYGTQSVFRGYGITCLIVVIGYFALNFFFISKLPPIVGAPPMTNELNDDSAYLAPHGVPGSSVSKSASYTRLDKGLEQQQQEQYQPQQQQYPYSADNQVPPAYVSSYPQAPQRVSDGIYRPGHMGTQWGQF